MTLLKECSKIILNGSQPETKRSSTNFHSIAELSQPHHKKAEEEDNSESVLARISFSLSQQEKDYKQPLYIQTSSFQSEKLSRSYSPSEQNFENRQYNSPTDYLGYSNSLSLSTSPESRISDSPEDNGFIRSLPMIAVTSAHSREHSDSFDEVDLEFSTDSKSLKCDSEEESPIANIKQSLHESASTENLDGSRDSNNDNKLRKGRTIYKANQVYLLENVFARTHYPDPEVIEKLSRNLNITENKIKVWFQNKRARWRKRTNIDVAAPAKSHHVSNFGVFPITSSPIHPSLNGAFPPLAMYPNYSDSISNYPLSSFQNFFPGHYGPSSTSPLTTMITSPLLHDLSLSNYLSSQFGSTINR